MNTGGTRVGVLRSIVSTLVVHGGLLLPLARRQRRHPHRRGLHPAGEWMPLPNTDPGLKLALTLLLISQT